MKLSEHVNLYHGGNAKKFAASVNKPYTTVLNQIAQGWSVNNTEVFDVKYKLTQTEIDHIKKIKEA
jgi:hypothetical protein